MTADFFARIFFIEWLPLALLFTIVIRTLKGMAGGRFV